MALGRSGERTPPLSSEQKPESLLRDARQAAGNAYAPYSRFAVGAAAETIDGAVFVGANMENASYGLTLCAEGGAIQAASGSGSLGNIMRIAIVGGAMDPLPGVAGRAVTPCGRCRQLILESSHWSGLDIEVWCSDLDLVDVVHYRISELLPHAFGPGDLHITSAWRELSLAFRRRLRG